MNENNKKETASKAVQEKKEGKKISEKNLAIIITAAILAVILIITAVVFIVKAVQQDKGFNYLTSDLSKYIEFTEDYKNFEIELDIAKPKDIDVDVAILSLLRADKSEKPLHNGGLVTSPMVIGAGDIVYIWYRGYLIGEDGEEIDVSGMSNFMGNSAAELEIGSAGFIPGFELGLVGQNTGDAAKFEKITVGKPTEGQVAYVTYTRVNTTTAEKTTGTNVRIDLSEDVDANYGNGFKDNILLAFIGQSYDFKTENNDGQTYDYTGVKVNFVTECESNPLIVETYFPYDYSNEELRNETAIFEVYVDGVIDYDAPEFDLEYVQSKLDEDKLGITEEELNEYEGETLVEKYLDFAKKSVYKVYEEEYESLVQNAVWEHLQNIAKVIKYPTSQVDEIYNEYVDDIENRYYQSEGQLYNSYTGSYSTYSTLDSYAVAYYGLSSTDSWRSYLYGLAETLIKERMVMYYILSTEDLIPSDDDLAKLVEATKADYLDEYIDQYLSYEGKTKDDYTDEEYADFVEKRAEEVYSYYDDQHFEDTTYYDIVIKEVTDWPTVITLDDRRAYPVSK